MKRNPVIVELGDKAPGQSREAPDQGDKASSQHDAPDTEHPAPEEELGGGDICSPEASPTTEDNAPLP